MGVVRLRLLQTTPTLALPLKGRGLVFYCYAKRSLFVPFAPNPAILADRSASGITTGVLLAPRHPTRHCHSDGCHEKNT
jgi:hypothetical protein